MKKYVIATTLATLLASGLVFNGENVEAASNTNEVSNEGNLEVVNNTNEVSTYAVTGWIWYNTYYYANGSYEKSYLNYELKKKKKETYNAAGKLISIDYYYFSGI